MFFLLEIFFRTLPPITRCNPPFNPDQLMLIDVTAIVDYEDDHGFNTNKKEKTKIDQRRRGTTDWNCKRGSFSPFIDKCVRLCVSSESVNRPSIILKNT